MFQAVTDGTFIMTIGRSTTEMSTPCDRPHSWHLRAFVFALVVALASPLTALGATAEIPHENYDLIGSDIELVIAMLNASIRASEDSLRSFHDQDVDAADGYLDVATSVVGPAEAILDDIDEVAASHEQLSVLIPPFSGLHDEMQGFSDLEGRMLSIRDEVAAIAAEVDISDSDAIAAIDSIREMNAVLSAMNETIDAMLVRADEIDSLTVGDGHPFVPNDLTELIERLRELTMLMHEDIVELIEEGIPWQDDRSFLLLWVADPDLFLGETLSGGGYLLKNGTFISGSPVDVTIDGLTAALAYTNGGGAFSFSYTIPLNASWIGTHDLMAEANVSEETIVSDTLVITVSLVPTTLILLLSNSTVSPSEDLIVEAVLTRDRGLPLPGAECMLSVDGSDEAFVTDEAGRGDWAWAGATLGIGTHILSASYAGTLPYAPSESGEMSVVVDVPTAVTLNLFSDRLRKGYFVVGDGMLVVNVSSPLTGQRITLSIDGVAVTNVTTDATGKFAFSIDTVELDFGTHVLTAGFVDHDPYWRSSEDRVKFFIVGLSYTDYPFFPWIPGWDIGGGLQEQIPYLFFGEYAYFTWLFMILVVGVVIKALQVRKRRSLSEAASESVSADGGAPSASTSHGWTFASVERMPDWLVGPNERIIWHYHNLLAFLKAGGKMGITDNMTHWEVAGLLGSLGYPQGEASKVALLYEMAQYSGSESSEEDVAQMGSSSNRLRRSGGVRPAV